MKNALIILALFMGLNAKAEIKDEVLQVLKNHDRSTTYYVDKQSYVFNVNGYACAWPGLRIPDSDLDQDLNHYRKFGSDGHRLAVGIKNPNQRFCLGIPGAQVVFGPEFVNGAQLPMKIHRVLELIQRTSDDADQPKNQKLIRETITITINGRELETIAVITLENQKGE